MEGRGGLGADLIAEPTPDPFEVCSGSTEVHLPAVSEVRHASTAQLHVALLALARSPRLSLVHHQAPSASGLLGFSGFPTAKRHWEVGGTGRDGTGPIDTDRDNSGRRLAVSQTIGHQSERELVSEV